VTEVVLVVEPEVEAALRDLAVRYARGVDRRDAGTFLGVFEPDAVVVVRRPSTADRPSEIRGHDRLARIPEVIARYARTFHLLGQSSYRDLGDEAEGEVYCIAHHLDLSGEAATDLIMFIRYQDRYARDKDGTWRIRRREVLVDWTEIQPADAPDGDVARDGDAAR
jgi:ketosteroid isomerase-like protein